MSLLFKNNASTTLSGSINNTQTAVTVTSGAGFPVPSGSDYFYATMYEVSGGTEVNVEIVKVTGVSGNNWTIVRGQDGTTARSRDGVTACYIENRYTAASASLSLQKDNNLSDVTSASSARTNLGLGSLATQAADSVAITGGTISGVTITTLDSTTAIVDNADATKQVKFEVSGVSSGATRTLTVPNASGTLALTSDLSTGYQPLSTILTSVAGLAANGIIARTASGVVAARSITQPAAGITVTNGDGVSGNPTLGLANDLAAVESLSTTGFVRRTGADTWSASALVDGDLPTTMSGKTLASPVLTGDVGIGTSGPYTRLHVYNSAIAGGGPASSGGAVDPNSLVRFGITAVVLDFGAYANGDGWFQMRSAANYATNYGLGINPNGGRVFFGGAVQEKKVALGGGTIDLSLGNVFSYTVSGTTTFGVTSVPASGTVATILLDLTNGGSATVNWWSGVKWPFGIAPTLTASGRDVLGFFTHDGGTTWTGVMLAKDAK